MMPIIRLRVLSPNQVESVERTFVYARERERVRWELGIGRSRQDSRKSPDGPVS